jgi:hypothetical protein
MLIADYTNHNILKVDMTSKQISVYAHDSTMNQPNDMLLTVRTGYMQVIRTGKAAQVASGA